MRRYAFAAALLCAFAGARAQELTSAPVLHPAFPSDGTALAAAVHGILADPAVSRAHWGIAVTTIDGTPLFGLNEGQLFRPASNAKIYTSMAAIALLGPARTFETRVYGSLDAATGTVTGDLTLLGSGDANLDSGDLPYIAPADRPKNAPAPKPALPDLDKLANQIQAHGVRHITGDIIGDDRLFPYEPVPQGWGADDLVWGYGAPVSALSIADNELTLTVTPGTVTGPQGHEKFPAATVTLEQFGVPYYTVRAEVRTDAAGSKGAGVEVERNPGSRVVHVYGSIATDARPDVEHISIDDPAEFAAVALRERLTARGITVDGAAHARHQQPWQTGSFLGRLLAPDPCVELMFNGGACGGNHITPLPPQGAVLASHISAPLEQDIVLTDKISENLHAELLLHDLGLVTMSGYGSTLDGARVVRGFALHAGLDPGDFVFYDGSGLSTHDLVTPRATARLLTFAVTQPWFAQWKAALPVAGMDGSLASRYKDSPLKGKVFAKTGTLGETRALSGYLEAASGKTLIFSVMVDTHAPGTSADRDAMDRIVEAIAAAN